MKLILTDCLTLKSGNDISLEIFKNFGEASFFDNIKREELLKEAEDTDIILCNKTVIDKEVMKRAKKLKHIGIFATGYNNIDIEFAKQRGITVCNAGSYSTNAVAQQVFAYLLNFYSRVYEFNKTVGSGGWKQSETFTNIAYTTDELSGKTIGIIGFGNIGKKVSKIANSFDMNVLVYTRTVRDDDSVSFVSLDELLKRSDIVTVHCPLNGQSKGMFNNEAFKKMKDGAYFINTSRGGVVDENALLFALKSKKLSGAAVDVLSSEPMSKDCVLYNAPNITITPHVAWAPLKTRKNLIDIVAKNLSSFLEGNPINIVSK